MVDVIHFLYNINQPYSCAQWGDYGTIGIPPIVNLDVDEEDKFVLDWFENPSSAGLGSLIVFFDHTMTVVNIMSSSPSFYVANAIIGNMLNDIPVISGCVNLSACNYDPDANSDDGSCTYPEENYDCDSNCIVEVDCTGECGGVALDDECGICIDPVCNDTGTPSPFTAGNNPCQVQGEYPISMLWNSTCDPNLSLNNISLPLYFKINNIYPNPFNPILNIDFEINRAGWVKVNITDITGSMVKTVYDGFEGVGKHQISWDSETLPSGTYFVTLELNESLRTKKVVLLK